MLPGLEMMMSCPNLAVPTEVMRHVVSVESGANPFAIGVVGGRLVRQPKNLDEAVATANMLETKGYNYSLGLAQVNRVNFGKYGFDTPAKAFDVCANLSAGANILADCYRDARGNWGKAFSCYYSGNFITGFLQGYVQKIYNSILAGVQVPASPSRAAATPARFRVMDDVLVMASPSRAAAKPFMSDSNAAAYAVAASAAGKYPANASQTAAAASAAGTFPQVFPKKQTATTVKPPAAVPRSAPQLTAPPLTAQLLAATIAQRIAMRSVPAADPANVDAPRPVPAMPAAAAMPLAAATTAAASAQMAGAAARPPAPVAVRATSASGIFEPQVSGPNDPPSAAANGPVVTPPVARDSAFVF